KTLVAFAAIAVLAGIPFSLGKYFELNFPDPYDSGGYAYSAAHILAGAEIGVDEKPSAQLGTLLVNILGVWLSGEFSETGPKVLQMVFQAAALVLMFAAMRKLFGTLPAAVGVILASVYLSAPLIAKFGNVKEQHMIAFMVIGASCFVLYQLGGKWWWAVLAGAFVSWAPLFKPTGTSVIGAMGLFVIAQPFLKHRSFRQTGIDILLLLAGVAVAIGPLYLWILAWDVKFSLPYSFAWKTLGKMLPAGGASEQAKGASGYVSAGRKLVTFSQQWPKVVRFYCLLILPIALSVGAIGARISRMIGRVARREKVQTKIYDRFVLMFAVWWLLDMAFVWISPRSYDQYYLPLNAPAAMLGGYLVALYIERLSEKPAIPATERTMLLDVAFVGAWAIAAWFAVQGLFRILFKAPDVYEMYGYYRVLLSAAVIMLGLGPIGLLRNKLSKSTSKFRWGVIGVCVIACMTVMSWHIFFGVRVSPFSGSWYPNRKARRGYAQKYDDISGRRKTNTKGPWEQAGEYIRVRTEPTDKIYVWGWYPGIYVSAQRFSAASKPAMMPRPAPAVFARMIAEMLAEFEKEKPKFIVDSRKRHVPMERPPYELWPIVPKGRAGMNRTWFLPLDNNVIETYDKTWSEFLRVRFDAAEAQRYEALAPLREFVMKNYMIVEPRQYVATQDGRLLHRMFGKHVLFRLKNPTPEEQM
ncbi:MAG: ArnT family glycosyltransferase, partial [Planctomycetota bacterium]